ncbi:MAG: prolyl oligopeptidase PreP (S9A serine peptidase family) [Chitinophagales bacterium]|jgi:prolyl oligopeptidase PreP (S9A serine peptidase family)
MIAAVSDASGEFFVRYERFITPPTLCAVSDSVTSVLVRQQSDTCDSQQLTVNQFLPSFKWYPSTVCCSDEQRH